MEIVKGILIIVGVVGLGTYLLRLLWQTISKEAKRKEYKLPSHDEVLNTGDSKYTIKPKDTIDRLEAKRKEYKPPPSEPILKDSSNDGFIWTESETMSNDSFDSLYHTSHTIDDSPSFGNGGDFGGGGASGSWDSGSSSDSSYDSGSSDSSSSWSD